MKKRILSLALAAVLTLGLAVPAMAAGQTFSDVPASYWGYADIEAVAEAGLMKGTGGDLFSPEMKVSVAQFLTLLGRLVFPEVKADGADWFGPYVTAAQDAKLLDGTQVDTNNVEAEISRYDMAAILEKAAEWKNLEVTKASQSAVTDYGEIPAKYIDAVLAVYGMGLIRGDQAGKFNGTNTMIRAEVATVIMRLARATGSQGGATTNPEQPEKPTEATYSLKVGGGFNTDGILVPGEKVIVNFYVDPSSAAPYGNDRTGFTYTSSDPSILELAGKASNAYDHWYVIAHREGTATITVTDPYGVTGSREFTVVSARDGTGTKTYAVYVSTARQERHTLRGNAYTEKDIIPDVPYKIYYTRDGGKTSQVVYEGVASDHERIEIELPEDAFYSQDAGLYVSGEAMLDGQRLVTSDLRTDGRAYPSIVYHISEVSATPGMTSQMEFRLTPPTGEKAKFTTKGEVVYGLGGTSRVGEGFTVQLHLKDGRVVGETTTDANGEFFLECEVDAVDNGFNADVEQYYFTASGVQNGVPMEKAPWSPNGNQRLRSVNSLGGNPYNMNNTGTFMAITVSEK